jgi:hypothetical protein
MVSISNSEQSNSNQRANETFAQQYGKYNILGESASPTTGGESPLKITHQSRDRSIFDSGNFGKSDSEQPTNPATEEKQASWWAKLKQNLSSLIFGKANPAEREMAGGGAIMEISATSGANSQNNSGRNGGNGGEISALPAAKNSEDGEDSAKEKDDPAAFGVASTHIVSKIGTYAIKEIDASDKKHGDIVGEINSTVEARMKLAVSIEERQKNAAKCDMEATKEQNSSLSFKVLKFLGDHSHLALCIAATVAIGGLMVAGNFLGMGVFAASMYRFVTQTAMAIGAIPPIMHAIGYVIPLAQRLAGLVPACTSNLVWTSLWKIVDSGLPAMSGAQKSFEANNIRAEIETTRAEISAMDAKIATIREELSTQSQKSSVLTSMMQSVISAESEARRAISSNIR